MIVKIARTAVFIPEWRDNKKEAEPVRVEYRFPTTEERDRFIRWSTPKLISAGGEDARSEVERVIDRRGMFLGLVTSIANLTISDGGKDRIVATAKAVMVIPGLNDLYDEVCAHLIQVSAVTDLKN